MADITQIAPEKIKGRLDDGYTKPNSFDAILSLGVLRVYNHKRPDFFVEVNLADGSATPDTYYASVYSNGLVRIDNSENLAFWVSVDLN